MKKVSAHQVDVITGTLDSQGPVIWSRVPETTLPQRQVYPTFIYENVVPVGRAKVNPA